MITYFQIEGIISCKQKSILFNFEFLIVYSDNFGCVIKEKYAKFRRIMKIHRLFLYLMFLFCIYKDYK